MNDSNARVIPSRTNRHVSINAFLVLVQDDEDKAKEEVF